LENILVLSLMDKITQIFSVKGKDNLFLADKSPILQASAFAHCFPQVAFASDGSDSYSGCCGSLGLCGIMLIAFYFIFRGCFGSFRGCCFSHPDEITTEDRCGGKRTYKRDSCTGRYREKSGCC